MGKIKVTQIKSAIGYNKKDKLTLEALGIKRMNSSVVHNDSPQIRGMVAAINYLIKVEEI